MLFPYAINTINTSNMVICLMEIMLFYHHLRVINKPISHPTGKYGTSLIASWADKVTIAANACKLSHASSSSTLSSWALVTTATATRTDSPRFAVYQPRGLKLDNKDEILAYLNPEPKPKTGLSNYVSYLTCRFLFSLMEIVPDPDTLEA